MATCVFPKFHHCIPVLFKADKDDSNPDLKHSMLPGVIWEYCRYDTEPPVDLVKYMVDLLTDTTNTRLAIKVRKWNYISIICL